MAHCFVTRQLPGSALDRLAQAHDVDVWAQRLPPDREQLIAHTREAEGLIALLSERISAIRVIRAFAREDSEIVR